MTTTKTPEEVQADGNASQACTGCGRRFAPSALSRYCSTQPNALGDPVDTWVALCPDCDDDEAWSYDA